MHRVSRPAWWYDLRYGNAWRVAIILGALLVVIAVVTSFGASSPEEQAERQRQVEAQCVAQGGHVVEVIGKFRVSRVCYGG